MSQSRPRRTPTGPDEVRASLIRAATDLIATRQPRTVPSREIAARAGVNYGLIHVYFGGKTGLLRAVFESATNQMMSAGPLGLAEPDALTGKDAAAKRKLLRVVANLAADEATLVSMGWEFPMISRMLADRRQADPAQPDSEVLAEVAAVVVVLFGWELMEPALRLGLDLTEESAAELKSSVFARVVGAIRAP